MDDPGSRSKVGQRRWWRLGMSLRTLMVLVLIVGGVLGWQIRRAAIQRQAVAAIKAAGGSVFYDYQYGPKQRFVPSASPSTPRWLRAVAGDELFQEVAAVFLKNSRTERPPLTPATLDAILALDRLQFLSIIYVPLADAQVERLSGLTQLRELVLLDVPVTAAALAALRHMPHLTDLSLRVKPAGLPGSSLRHLAGMTQLEQLEILGLEPVFAADLAPLATLPALDHLRLMLSPEDGAWVEHIQPLANLKILDFRETRATDADLAVLATLPKLEILRLDGANVTDAGLAHLGRLKTLTDLMITSPDRPGRLTDAGVGGLAALTKLNGLAVDAHGLTAAGFAPLAAVPIQDLTLTGLAADQQDLARAALTHPLMGLELGGPGVTADWLDLLANQGAITNLTLNGTTLGDAAMPRLAALMPRVSYLYLDSTALTDAGLLKLAAAPSLRSISALGTQVTPAGIAALRTLRPGIQVEIGPVVPFPRHAPRSGR